MKTFVRDPIDLNALDPALDLNGIQLDQALGFLTCTPDLDHGELVRALSRCYPLPIVGGTVLGNPFESGEDPFISRFSILGKKNIRRHAAVSDPIAPYRPGCIARALRECRERLDGDVKLLLVMIPLQRNLYIDPFFSELVDEAGDTPIFGGLLSDELNSRRSTIFANGHEYTDRLLVVGFGGDIRPAFATGCGITLPSEYEPAVTSSRDNIIETVDGMNFLDYLRRIGLDETCVAEFPVALRVRDAASAPGGPLKVLGLTSVDAKRGLGVVSSCVMPGDRVSIGYLTVDNIANSTQQCVDGLAADMARQSSDGYRYEMLFGVSCLARYYTIFNNKNIEAENINSRLADIRARFGFYAMGELCPTRLDGGGLVNGKFGKTLGLCAI